MIQITQLSLDKERKNIQKKIKLLCKMVHQKFLHFITDYPSQPEIVQIISRHPVFLFAYSGVALNLHRARKSYFPRVKRN